MKITFSEISMPRSGPLVVTVTSGSTLLATAKSVDKKTDGALTAAIAASRFEGKSGQTLTVMVPKGVGASRVLLLGLGDGGKLDALGAQAAGGAVVANLAMSGEKLVNIAVDNVPDSKLNLSEVAANLAFGVALRSYRFDHYFTKKKPEEKPSLAQAKVMCRNATVAKKIYTPLDKIADGIFETRNLVSEPANIIYPETLANQAKELTKVGVKVEVLNRARMEKLGMGALLAVAQGSAREPRLVIMRWDGAPKSSKRKPVALVGKGVTFDSGGISLKPSAGMEDMKWDMGGAGVVIGTMKALAGRKAKANVVGVVGLVENMPSGTAQRPGDVVTSASGQTIEVLNTDAEGRLVLADALWYTQQRFKPEIMVNLATLTGAIIVSLGSEHAGLFSNNDELAERLAGAGTAEGEKLWRLPLTDGYDKLIKSNIADMQNIGYAREAGSITAAQFLQRFVNKVPWAHLDIAGVTWSGKDKATVPKGGTGFGVRLLNRLIADHYEKK